MAPKIMYQIYCNDVRNTTTGTTGHDAFRRLIERVRRGERDPRETYGFRLVPVLDGRESTWEAADLASLDDVAALLALPRCQSVTQDSNAELVRAVDNATATPGAATLEFLERAIEADKWDSPHFWRR